MLNIFAKIEIMKAIGFSGHKTAKYFVKNFSKIEREWRLSKTESSKYLRKIRKLYYIKSSSGNKFYIGFHNYIRLFIQAQTWQ